ncbi:MAG: YciI family protein [Acidimicrobiales bacterium]
MKQYLLSTYHPDGPPPPSVDMEQVVRDVTALAAELKEAGAWVFASHLHPSSTAKVVRVWDGETLITDGPYVEGKEHVGGITIVQAPDLDAALAWAKKLSDATTLPIEVRPFLETQEGLK